MREILFRGKRKDNGEWVEGYYQPPACGVGVTLAVFRDSDCLTDLKVVPETVGQYIGLNDKNGKKIFEGDICEYREEYGEIAYSPVDARFVVEFDTWCTDFDHLNGHELEVIGNSYDNPELLE